MARQKWNLNTIYISERLKACLRPVTCCALTTAIKRMEVPVYIWETGIKNKIPTELEKRKLDMLRDIICLYYIVLIIPFASLKAQTSYEKCCVPPLFDL